MKHYYFTSIDSASKQITTPVSHRVEMNKIYYDNILIAKYNLTQFCSIVLTNLFGILAMYNNSNMWFAGDPVPRQGGGPVQGSITALWLVPHWHREPDPVSAAPHHPWPPAGLWCQAAPADGPEGPGPRQAHCHVSGAHPAHETDAERFALSKLSKYHFPTVEPGFLNCSLVMQKIKSKSVNSSKYFFTINAETPALRRGRKRTRTEVELEVKNFTDKIYRLRMTLIPTVKISYMVYSVLCILLSYLILL